TNSTSRTAAQQPVRNQGSPRGPGNTSQTNTGSPTATATQYATNPAEIGGRVGCVISVARHRVAGTSANIATSRNTRVSVRRCSSAQFDRIRASVVAPASTASGNAATSSIRAGARNSRKPGIHSTSDAPPSENTSSPANTHAHHRARPPATTGAATAAASQNTPNRPRSSHIRGGSYPDDGPASPGGRGCRVRAPAAPAAATPARR